MYADESVIVVYGEVSIIFCYSHDEIKQINDVGNSRNCDEAMDSDVVLLLQGKWKRLDRVEQFCLATGHERLLSTTNC